MVNDAPILSGIVTGDTLDSVYRKRHPKYLSKKIVKQDIQPFINEGWEKCKYKSKTHIKLRKLKGIGQDFEDEVWCIFKKMGFKDMNADSSFSIPRKNRDIQKQIDIFAKDGQVIVIIECKAAEKPHTRKSLDKDIDQFCAIKYELELSIFKHYNPPTSERKKYKIIWAFAVKNIDISSKDQMRAESGNIKILDYNAIEYYAMLAQHFGDSAKYQFLAHMFPGIGVPDLIEPLPAMKGKMGNAEFYSFLIEPIKLLKIAYIAHRAKTNEESIDTYQRMAKKSRLKKIAEYIHVENGIFPTSIVINIETKRKLKFEPAAEMSGKNAVLGTLHLPNKFKTAWIIDGQHRLFAYSNIPEANTATLPVIAFENLDPDIQAKMFVDINGEQVKVSKNLLHDLYANLHWNSKNPREQLLALTSRLVKDLNEHPKSPLRDRIIKIGGRKTNHRSITITAISNEIRKSKLLGYVVSRKDKTLTPGPLYAKNMDKTSIRSREIISGYYNFFLQNDETKKQWEIGSGEGGYICTNSGIIATLRILKAIIDHIEKVEELDARKLDSTALSNNIEKYIEPIIDYWAAATPKLIKEFREKHGEAGFRACTYALLRVINETYPMFNPTGLQQYIRDTETPYNIQGYEITSKIEKMILKNVISVLKTNYGLAKSQWWHKGIKEKVRQSAMSQAAQAGEYEHFEKYLYLIELKDIIYDNWDLFNETYTIYAKPSDSKKKKLTWFTELNEIRNIVDHPPRGGINLEQLEFIQQLQEDIKNRIGDV